MISIIVPVYKVELYLDKCIRSILSQYFHDFELILVDDASPDRCGRMCDYWASQDPRVRVIHKEHGGLSEARNAGIAAAKGDYIGFVDSDDWIHPGMYDVLYSLAKDTNADMAVCRFVPVLENGTELPDKSVVKPGVYTPDHFWTECFAHSVRTYYNVAWNKLYKRELFDHIKFASGKINEDILIMRDLVKACRLIALTDEVGYYYLQRGGSIMQSERTVKHLAGSEGFLQWTEDFAKEGRLTFAIKSLWIYLSTVLTKEYGKGWRKSQEYQQLKKKFIQVYKLFPAEKFNRRTKFLIFLYIHCEPLARCLYRIWISGKENA